MGCTTIDETLGEPASSKPRFSYELWNRSSTLDKRTFRAVLSMISRMPSQTVRSALGFGHVSDAT